MKYKKGFTLLEILLVIALIGVLAAIVLIAINPTRQLAQARNVERLSDINTIYQAIEQFVVDSRGEYPQQITNTIQNICRTGTESIGGPTDCSGSVDLRILVPQYLSSIPEDPLGGAYQIRINPDNNQLSIRASSAELNQSVVINPRVLPWAEGGDNIYIISASGTNYRVHEFTTPGSTNMTFTRGGDVEYLVVGGGGGSAIAAGPPTAYPYPGGGGQVVSGVTTVNSQSYPVIVGAGGIARTGGAPGDNGLASSIFSINANPGIGGANVDSGDSGSGFVGGARSGCGTGGGAGAGGNGGNAIPTCGNNGTGGAGGIGVQSSITGTALGYGGGGSGVSWNQGAGPVVDGGGMVGLGINHVAIPAILPTRGGGGGSWQNGGNGTVIVRYEVEL